MQLENLMRSNLRCLLVGGPGTGKTSRIGATCKAVGRRMVICRASLSERVDFGGCLVPDVGAGITRSLPLELLADLRTTKTPTTLVYDDLGQAPIDVQAALMKTFDAGELSDQVLIWGATNRPGDKAGVSALCEPLRSRFDVAFAIPTPGTEDKPDGAVMLGTWKQEVENWCQWALDNNAPPEIIAWHRGFQSIRVGDCGPVLYGWKPHADPGVRLPDYRSWETAIKLWNFGFKDVSTIAAAIGKPQAAAFLAFASLADKLPTADQIWMDPMGAPVPEDTGGLFLIASMLAGAIEPKWAGPFCKYIGRINRIYAALAARDVYRKLGAKLSANPEWQKWFLTNQELFAVNT